MIFLLPALSYARPSFSQGDIGILSFHLSVRGVCLVIFLVYVFEDVTVQALGFLVCVYGLGYGVWPHLLAVSWLSWCSSLKFDFLYTPFMGIGF